MNNRKRLVLGVGVNDWGRPTSNKDGSSIPEYLLWRAMLHRCFGNKSGKNLTTYNGVSCSDSWRSMRSFISDVSTIENYDKVINGDWAMDKDILKPGNKRYSLESICFVPKQINNAYKNYKRDSGLPCGVYLCTEASTFYSKISIDGKQRYLGTFSCANKAHEVFCCEKKKYIAFLANRWRSKISKNVYDAMISYEPSSYLTTLAELKSM